MQFCLRTDLDCSVLLFNSRTLYTVRWTNCICAMQFCAHYCEYKYLYVCLVVDQMGEYRMKLCVFCLSHSPFAQFLSIGHITFFLGLWDTCNGVNKKRKEKKKDAGTFLVIISISSFGCSGFFVHTVHNFMTCLFPLPCKECTIWRNQTQDDPHYHECGTHLYLQACWAYILTFSSESFMTFIISYLWKRIVQKSQLLNLSLPNISYDC